MKQCIVFGNCQRNAIIRYLMKSKPLKQFMRSSICLQCICVTGTASVKRLPGVATCSFIKK